MKRFTALLLCMLLVAGMLPSAVFAGDIKTEFSGTLTWSLDTKTMTLTISGKGAMTDYSDANDAEPDILTPFYGEYSSDIKNVIIEEGVSSVGDHAFQNYHSLKEITIPSTVEHIGFATFENTGLENLIFPSGLNSLEALFGSGEPCKIIVFTGDAPELIDWLPFTSNDSGYTGDLTNIFYPEDNLTWTKDVKDSFGERIRWNTEVMPGASVSNVFDDIKEGAWYCNAVQYMFERELMEGIAKGVFAPSMKLTRAQLAQILFNYSGVDADTVQGEVLFSDVSKNAWYAPAVTWMTANRLTSGVGDDKFAPNKEITRQELACFLYRYAQNLRYDVTYDDRAELSLYKDEGAVADWAYDSVAWAVGMGVIAGFEGGILAPNQTATRAQTAQMIMKFDEYLIENAKVTTGVFRTLADHIIENGKYGYEASYWPDTYSYFFGIGDMTCTAEYFPSSDAIKLYCCGESYKEHLYTGSHVNCLECSSLYIGGLWKGYNYVYEYDIYDEKDDPEIGSRGRFTVDGYEEEKFNYGRYDDFSGNTILTEEDRVFATQKRDTAVANMQAFIEHLMSECGLEYKDFFVEK